MQHDNDQSLMNQSLMPRWLSLTVCVLVSVRLATAKEREAAFALVGVLAQFEGTGETRYIEHIRGRVALLHQMQQDNGPARAWVHNMHDHDPSEGCAVTEYGSSPWMSGLMLEGVVKYHKLTGDPVARESILMAVDDLRFNYLASAGGFAGRSFIYLGCSM
jgi:hypothetical protein